MSDKDEIVKSLKELAELMMVTMPFSVLFRSVGHAHEECIPPMEVLKRLVEGAYVRIVPGQKGFDQTEFNEFVERNSQGDLPTHVKCVVELVTEQMNTLGKLRDILLLRSVKDDTAKKE